MSQTEEIFGITAKLVAVITIISFLLMSIWMTGYSDNPAYWKTALWVTLGCAGVTIITGIVSIVGFKIRYAKWETDYNKLVENASDKSVMTDEMTTLYKLRPHPNLSSFDMPLPKEPVPGAIARQMLPELYQ